MSLSYERVKAAWESCRENYREKTHRGKEGEEAECLNPLIPQQGQRNRFWARSRGETSYRKDRLPGNWAVGTLAGLGREQCLNDGQMTKACSSNTNRLKWAASSAIDGIM